MVKQIFSTLALAALAVTAGAQTVPNRLLVHQKSGAVAAHRVNSVDSLTFATVEGDVRADVTFNKYATGLKGDTVWVAVKKTNDCATYRIDVRPTAQIGSYNDDVLARWFDLYGGAQFNDDFTNAMMTGFDTPFKAGTDYTVFTVAYDGYGTACDASRARFTTPAANLVGDPQLVCTVESSTTTSVKFRFKPNADVSEYYICIFKKGEADAQFLQWAPMFGFSNMGDMIKQFSGESYSGTFIKEITGLTPGTDYEMYVQPLDADGNYASLVKTECATKKMGGQGEAKMTISIGEFGGDATNGYYQTVTYTPNDQTALHRDMLIEKKAYEESWGKDKVVEYLKTDNEYDPYWDQYGVDVAQWNASPNTTYYAASIGKNANDEWGELVMVEFTTPSKASSVNAGAVPQRVAKAQAPQTGRAPKAAKRAVSLVEAE